MSFAPWKSCASQKGHVVHGGQGGKRFFAKIAGRRSGRWASGLVYNSGLEIAVRSGRD